MCLKRLIELIKEKINGKSTLQESETIEEKTVKDILPSADGMFETSANSTSADGCETNGDASVLETEKAMTVENFNSFSDDSGPSLSYRTIANEDPHGKSRVFFTCHPDDFEIFFEQVKDWLFKYQNNCVIWYEKSGTVLMNNEELKSQLCEMQLVVMPITTRLLTKPNRAVDLVLPFVNEKHIPVLPLMMENSLDDDFRAKFGKVQYLKPGDPDPTAVPFEHKLEKYLDRVLVGAEQAQRVRKAFNAYIFMSYRKKDRAYAQELMRLIHKNEEFRDIAIWYDEYLVPGEDYSDSIRKALETGSLFTLVVTPNLLERYEGKANYVMAHEYPAARKAGKPILPVQMAEVDRVQLEKEYKDIPACVDGRDNQALRSKLEGYLNGVVMTKQDPDHDFLIGLAYLDGIDVEVDNEKAVSLITGAAEAGDTDAIRKLESMYWSGKGVERDYDTSVKWQEILTNIYRKRYQECKDEGDIGELFIGNDLENLFNALSVLGASLMDLGNLMKAKEIYEEMCAVAKEQVDRGDEIGKEHVVESYVNLGNAEISLGRPEEARQWYEASLVIRKELAEETKTIEARRGLAVIYTNLGLVENDLDHLEEAKKWFEAAVTIQKELAEKTKSGEARRELALNYSNLGLIEGKLGNKEESNRWYNASYAIRRELAKEMKTVEARHDLAFSYYHLGFNEAASDNTEEAKKWYEASLAIRKEIAEETKTIEARHELSESYATLGFIEQRLGNTEEAGQWYEASLAIRKEIAEETGRDKDYFSLAESYYNAGVTTNKMDYRIKAFQMLDELAKQYPSVVKYAQMRDIIGDLISR